MTQHPFSTAWHLKRRDATVDLEADFATSENWLEVTVPSTVYASLTAAGLIPDPYFGTNELDVQWVAETDWLYRTYFDTPDLETLSELCFEGLDTFATVWLNGTEILRSDNMFVPHRVNVSGLLRTKDNELRVLFESAWRRGHELQAAHGGAKPLWNGDSSRLHVRKAQFHYGWDWGPKLVDAGPWRAIHLETFTARIASWHCPVTLNEDLTRAELEVSIELEGAIEGTTLELNLFDPDGRSVLNATLPASSHNTRRCSIDHPRLWFPHTQGEQPLYTLTITLKRDGTELNAKTQRIGMRKIELAREPVAGESGSSFTFRVNNTEMFIGGANWIPDDVMLTRVTQTRYREAVQQAKSANMTMLRVWGGGIYEADTFYDACDELGVLVWQDFMFACGVYPAHPEFLNSVRLEAKHTIERLRHHPSLAIWTGNNEDYQLGYGMKWYDANLEPDDNPRFPARVIYEQLLPEMVTALDPGRYYQPGSPFFGTDPDDPTQGDRHTWDVWGRAALPYRQYQRLEGRFVSEFGMAAAPNLETIRDALPPEDWTPWSRGFEHHMKADDGMRRLSAYITDTQPTPHDLEGFVYATQLVQSEALDCAYRIWRRRWGQPGRRAVSGALVWQLNDCWPVTSWAIVDSSGTPKPAYYTIKRALEPITVNIWTDGAIWALSDHTEPQTLTLECRAIALDGTEVARETREVTLTPNGCTELGTWQPSSDEPVVIALRLMNDATVQARAALFPEPFKYHNFDDPGLEVQSINATQLRITARQPAKGVYLRSPELSDNMLDVVPGDPQILETTALPEELEVQWLGGYRHFSLERTLITGDD
jgi:beta-mannosidase